VSKHHIGRLGALAGLLVLAFTCVWSIDPPPSAQPLDGRFGDNAVLAFELARTPRDIEVVIGPNPPSEAHRVIRERLDTLTRQDFVYMAAYGALLVCGFVLLERDRGARYARAGIALVVVAVIADALENRVLLALTRADTDVEGWLGQLIVFTYVKWLLLAVAASLYSVLSLARDKGVSRVATVLGSSAILVGVSMIPWPSVASPLLVLSFAPTWLLMLVRCIQAARTRVGQTPSAT